MIGTGAAILGSAIIGGATSLYGASKAAKAQKDAADRALGLQERMFSQAQENLLPFVDVGKEALYSLAQLYGLRTPDGSGGEAFNQQALDAFRKSPDYAFRFQEGQRALTFSDAAKGLLRSRSHLANTVTFGQNMAGLGFNDYAGRLLDLSRIGAGSAATAAGANQGAATAMGGTIMGGGQAVASGYVGGANAINTSLQNATNNLMLIEALKRPSAFGAGNAWYGGPISGAPAGYGAYTY